MYAFDPATVYSSIDTGGRYAYGNQPVVAEWNLARLAEALLPLLHDDQDQAVALDVESPLVTDLVTLLQASHVDYTGFFRALGAAARGDAEPARGLFLDLAAF